MVGVSTQADLEEQLIRMERSREETRKFIAEQHKLMAEASKMERERALYPAVLAIGGFGAVIGSMLTLLAHFLH